MSDIEDNACNLTWWWEQLNLGDDWNSMPRDMRKILIKKLHRAFIDIVEFNISEKDIQNLIRLTDPPTVWDALLSLTKLPKNRSKWEVLAYLKAVVINTWKAQHQIEKPTWQQPLKERKKRKPASLEHIEKWSSMNFKFRHCDGCGKLLRGDNGAGLCRTCQRQRNGKEREY